MTDREIVLAMVAGSARDLLSGAGRNSRRRVGGRDPATGPSHFEVESAGHLRGTCVARVSRSCRRCGGRIVGLDWKRARDYQDRHNAVLLSTRERNREKLLAGWAQWGGFPAGAD